MEKRTTRSKPLQLVILNGMRAQQVHDRYGVSRNTPLECLAILKPNEYHIKVKDMDITAQIVDNIEVY